MTDKICIGVKKNKELCGNKAKFGTATAWFCGRHKHQIQLDECVVCFEKKELEKLKNCSHSFCKDCIKQLERPVCPLCRAPIKAVLTVEQIRHNMAEAYREQISRMSDDTLLNMIASLNIR